jgi:hypothetical protein
LFLQLLNNLADKKMIFAILVKKISLYFLGLKAQAPAAQNN